MAERRTNRPASVAPVIPMVPPVRARGDRDANERSAYADLPSVDAVLTSRHAALLASFSRHAALAAIREAIQAQRDRIRAGETLLPAETSADAVAEDALEIVRAKSRPRLRTIDLFSVAPSPI